MISKSQGETEADGRALIPKNASPTLSGLVFERVGRSALQFFTGTREPWD